jgi:DNA-binding NtrC family response regulator
VEALVADDNVSLAKAVRWALRRIVPPNWDVQVVHDGLTASYMLIMDPELKVAVIDYLLPRKDAHAIIGEALKIRPHLRGRIIVCSGIDEYPSEVEEALFTDFACKRLDKPFEFDDLERMVLEIIGVQ